MSWFRHAQDKDEVPSFRPAAADHEGFRTELLAMIDRLLPGAVDEATPHVLDRLIDRHTLVQLARLMKQWVEFQEELMPYLVEARAELAFEEVINEAQQRTMAELGAARDAAVFGLHSTEQLPAAFGNPRAIPAKTQE